MHQCNEQHTTDSPVEISKRMNGLKPSISHSQKLHYRPEIRRFRPNLPYTFSEIVAKQPHVNRHFIEGRRLMPADLHIPVTETAGPIREQRPG